jgi:hypothetical protein
MEAAGRSDAIVGTEGGPKSTQVARLTVANSGAPWVSRCEYFLAQYFVAPRGHFTLSVSLV